MKQVVALIIVLVVALAGCGDDGTNENSALDQNLPAGIDALIELEVIDGAPVGGAQTISVSQGDTVRLEVTGNTEGEVHVHAYDHVIDLVDGEGELEFDALIPGTFEVELEGSGRLLVRMTVQ